MLISKRIYSKIILYYNDKLNADGWIMDCLNIEKYKYHKNLFGIKETPYIKLFEEFICSSNDFFIECSLKINKNKVHPLRINVYYWNKNDVKENFDKILRFFEKMGKLPDVSINSGFYDKIIDKDMNFNKVLGVAVGIDFRQDSALSRVKLWTGFKDYPEKEQQVLSLHGFNKDIKNILTLFDSDMFSFGFDFYFNGKSRIKIYPHIQESLKSMALRERLRAYFHESVYDLLDNSCRIHLSFDGADYKKIIHFFPHPYSYTDFIRKLNFKQLEKLHEQIYKKYNKYRIIAVAEDEIISGKITNAGLYY
ncbi:MAG: LynF/TruF/PatF family peptide O-prenyltransferase [Armatimonadota bacterium]